MDTAYEQLTEHLEEFNEVHEELKQLYDVHEHEILMTNRLLKNEVIDMAETID